MRIEMLAKDGDSGNFGCPAVYLAESGELVVQGQQVDQDTHSNLSNVLAGETAVRIKLDVVAEALRKHGVA